MARTVAGLGEGTRVTDYISLGVVAKTFPLHQVLRVSRITDFSATGLMRHFLFQRSVH